MTFTLNQVTRRAGGGDIVRTREFETGQISIGRGSDCDIQLQDLAVSLRHATMRQTGPSEVVIEALGKQPFEIDGKFAIDRFARSFDIGYIKDLLVSSSGKSGTHDLSMREGDQ